MEGRTVTRQRRQFGRCKQVLNPNISREVKSFSWEKRGRDKQKCAWIGTEKCKTEEAKIEGLSKG